MIIIIIITAYLPTETAPVEIHLLVETVLYGACPNYMASSSHKHRTAEGTPGGSRGKLGDKEEDAAGTSQRPPPQSLARPACASLPVEAAAEQAGNPSRLSPPPPAAQCSFSCKVSREAGQL